MLILSVLLAFIARQSTFQMVWIMSLFCIVLNLSLFSLMTCYMCGDFSIYTIFTNSNANTPLLFKLSATWSNHEGSLLLWCWLFSVFGLLFCYGVQPWSKGRVNGALRSDHNAPEAVYRYAIPIISRGVRQHMYLGLFLAVFLLSTSNPFLRIPFLCLNSVAELNPVLQDPILAIHPPCIYAGYVASAVGFSISLSRWANGLSLRNWSEMWIQIRVWSVIAWCFLTVGILLGSWWAYHELGWGGWWFWDPVENASLMPWLIGTACIHSVLVPRNNGWTLFMNILIFVLSICGTFFVRSGLLASVHSFATDSTRGLFILCFVFCILALCANHFVRFSLRSTAAALFHSHRISPQYSVWTIPYRKRYKLVPNSPATVVSVSPVSRYPAMHLSSAFDSLDKRYTLPFCDSGAIATRGLSISADLLDSRLESRLVEESLLRGMHPQHLLLSCYASKSTYSSSSAVSITSHSFALQVFGSAELELMAPPTIQGKPVCFARHSKQRGACAVPRTLEAYPSPASQGTTSALTASSLACPHQVTWLMSFARSESLLRLTETLCFARNSHREVKLAPMAHRSAEHRLSSIKKTQRSPVSASPVAISSANGLTEVQKRGYTARPCTPFNPPLGNSRPSDSSTRGGITNIEGNEVTQRVTYIKSLELGGYELSRQSQFTPQKTSIYHMPISRTKTRIEQLLQLQNVLLCTICGVVMCGTVAPICFQALYNRDVSTGAAFFNGLLVPIFLGVLLVLTYAHSVQLRFGSIRQTAPKAHRSALGLLGALCVLLFVVFTAVYAAVSVCEAVYALCVCVLFCSVLLSPQRRLFIEGKLNCTCQSLPSRLVAFTRAFHPRSPFIARNMQIAHASVALFISGVLLSNNHKIQFTQIMRSGHEVQLGKLVCCLRGIDHNYGPTYRAICGNVVVYPQQRPTACGFAEESRLKGATYECDHVQQTLCMFPEKRFCVSNEALSTTKVAIHTNFFSDCYANIGAGSAETGWFVTVMHLPYIVCIWLAFGLAAIGGLMSLRTLLKTNQLYWH